MEQIRKNIVSYKGHVTRATKTVENSMELGDDITESRSRLIKQLDKLGNYIQEKETLEIQEELVPYYEDIARAREEMKQKLKRYREGQVEARDDGTEDENIGAMSQLAITKIPKNTFKKPPEISGECDMQEFESWRRKINDYFILTGSDQCENRTQIAIIRGFLATDMYAKIRYSMGIEDDTELTKEEILEEIRKFIRSKTNLTIDRVKFEGLIQKEGEDFENFYCKVQETAASAELCNNHCNECKTKCFEQRIVTKIMSGIKDPEIQTKLLAIRDENADLQKIVDICRTEEAAHKDERRLCSKDVNAVLEGEQLVENRVEYRGDARRGNRSGRGKPTQRYGSPFKYESYEVCTKCGWKHDAKRRCPACFNCGKSGIWQEVVKSEQEQIFNSQGDLKI